MTGTTRRAGTTVGSGTETTGARRVYAYDNIGNRDTYTKGTGAQTSYETNNLNQYENVETASSPVTGQNMIYDADGNVIESYVVGDFDGDGSVGFSDLAIFSSSYGYCEGDPEFDERANLVTGDDPECIDEADQSAFMSLFGLSATSVMRAQMLWDAENRLAAYIPLNQSGGAKKVTFTYDYRGRRMEKNVYAWYSGGSAWYTVPTERRRFVWNGWLMLRETIETDSASDGTFEATRVKTYTWGKDLGGGLESAGGIGGLLAVYDDSATSGSTGDDLAYVYMYDANGNVGQVCDLSQSTASASIVAKYEYDAYGNATVSSGSYASANTYRFSTRPWDDETGLGYWGYRYYDPRLGRWMSRDPLNELGAVNLYAITHNQPTGLIDALGLTSLISCEQWWCMVNPIACFASAGLDSLTIRTIWDSFELTYRHDGTVFNALEHCVWSCMVASAGGVSCEEARDLGEAHEEGDDSPGSAHDLVNNRVGRGCAGCVGRDNEEGDGASEEDAASSLSHCLDCCKRRAMSCDLSILNTDCTLYPPGSKAREFCEEVNRRCQGRRPRPPFLGE